MLLVIPVLPPTLILKFCPNKGEVMTDKDIIKKAFFALAGYKDPSRTKKQQEDELNRCWEILAAVVYK